jgi:hypothetical protein
MYSGPILSSPKGTAFGGMTLSSTKTLYSHKGSLVEVDYYALTQTRGTGEPCILKLAVLVRAASIQEVFVITI